MTARRATTTTRARRPLAALVATAAAALVAAGCSQAPPATAGQREGVGQREVAITLSGADTYANSGLSTDGGVRVTYASNSGVTRLSGAVQLPGVSGGSATATFELSESFGTYGGTVRIQDPSVGLDRTVAHTSTAITFDNDGDASATASAGGVTIDWSIETLDASGLEPALDALHDAEADFCKEAQRSLTGLSELDLPDAAIDNTVHSSRAAYGASKASLVPLAVQTWSEVDQVTTAAGNNVAISHRLSCKTRAADHLATIGLPTGTPQACSTLTERSFELARAEMSQAERDAYDSSGRQVALQADRLAPTGNDYLTPFVDEVVDGSVLEVTAGSLRTDWNDPAYTLLPDNIRGVHYCTFWAPAWAYWWMTEGAFQP